ncbi:hypothetical protein TL16_g12464 [Triparma laevis f. inornata]|uniref:Ras-GAP domain-containing protein n=1 Tax=Triparma laevis f. inornata TaxID=1714386 RepID=A0A9W7BLF4_9STRA|nr:hypothetical protein TL16_g12464 [Triparma laevis f. inornata]
MQNSPTSWMKKGDARKLSLKPVQPGSGADDDNGSAMISDKSLDKARISAKRASIVKLTAKFDMLKATGSSGGFDGTDSPDMIIYEKPKKKPDPARANVEPDEESQPTPKLETNSSIRSLEPELDPHLSTSSRPSSTQLPAPATTPGSALGDRMSTASVDSVSDVMIRQAKKAARRASLKKSIAELTLLKSGTSTTDVLADLTESDSKLTFHPDTYNLGAAEPSKEDTEGRKKKFLLDTIMSGSNIDFDARNSSEGRSKQSVSTASFASPMSTGDLSNMSNNEQRKSSSTFLSIDEASTTPTPTDTDTPDPTPDSTITTTTPTQVEPSMEHKTNPSVLDVISLIANGPKDLQQNLEATLKAITADKDRLRSLMKTNFLLHHDVISLDEQIKMLIKNRITVEDIAHQFSHLIPSADGEEVVRSTLSQEKQILYGQLFYELQHNPNHLVRAARCATGSAASNFTNTVLLSIFGDQYDNNEEHNLLVMLRDLLQMEFDGAKEIATFMRSNTCLTQMLSTYVRRPGSINAIKELLAPVLEEVIQRKDSLEVSPHKVYMELINSFEQETGEKSPLERTVTEEQAAANEDVQNAQNARLEDIKAYVTRILTALEEGHDNILYGVRYLTRELNHMGENKWPNATARQKAAIMGGFFFLRFVTPIVVTPDGNNVTTLKVQKMQRRNLTLIAKVLQNLSNGILFGASGSGKEGFLKSLNPFIKEKFAVMDRIFKNLTKVEGVDDAMEMDQFLLINTVELTQRKSLKITYNEIMQTHNLIKENFKSIIQSDNVNDPLAKIIFMLGSPKKEVPRSENSTFSLTLDPLSLAERNSETGKIKNRYGPRLSVWDREVNARGRAVSKTNEIAQLGLIDRKSSQGSASDEIEERHKHTKLLLSGILAKLDLTQEEVVNSYDSKDPSQITMMDVLSFGVQKIQATGDQDKPFNASLVLEINDVMNDVLSMRDSIVEEETEDSEAPIDPDTLLICEVHDAYVQMNKSQIKVGKNATRLKNALAAIEIQHAELNDQIDTWKAYLENVKAQAMGDSAKKMKKEKSSRGGFLGLGKKKEPTKKDRVKFTYAELVKSNVITRSEIPTPVQSSVFFTFRVSPDVPGMFVVVASVRGFEAHRATLLLEDLLGEQDRGKEELDLDNVTLNVNMLIYLLNTTFGSA